MTHQTEAAVDRIFEHLRKAGLTIANRRRPGLRAHEISRALQEQMLDPPQSLIHLYQYCDGTLTFEGESLDQIQFFPGYYWTSLEDSLSIYRAISKSEEWARSWLPIFASGGGDFYAVICDSHSQYFGQVVGFILGESDQFVEFENVESLFRIIQKSFDSGAFFKSEGRIKADYVAMREIARQIQPEFCEHLI